MEHWAKMGKYTISGSSIQSICDSAMHPTYAYLGY